MYTIEQVCKKLGISRSLCYREIKSGNLRAHRFARRTYRVSPEDLAEYLQRCIELSNGSKDVSPTSHPKGRRTAFQHVDVSRWLSSQS